jgi:GTP-binding protein
VPYRIVLTKADKVKKDEMAKRLEKTNAILKKHPAAFPEALVTSSEKKIGISELQDVILAAC